MSCHVMSCHGIVSVFSTAVCGSIPAGAPGSSSRGAYSSQRLLNMLVSHVRLVEENRVELNATMQQEKTLISRSLA